MWRFVSRHLNLSWLIVKAKTKTVVSIAIYYLLLYSVLYAQPITVLRGKVIDFATDEPIPYASITLVGTYIGTVTNYNGDFILKIPETALNAEFKVAHMAYIPTQIKVKDFLQKPETIRLNSEIYYISSIDVKANQAEDTLLKALASIPNNYVEEPQFFRAYYREHVKEDSKTIQLNEAVLRIYKSGYNNSVKEAIELIKGRANANVYSSFLWNYIEFINGPYEMLYSDFVKHPQRFIQIPQSGANFLDPKNFSYYIYTMYRQVNLKNEPELIITFKPKKKSNRAKFEGTIVLESETLAFKQLSYTVADNRINGVHLISADTYSFLSSRRFNISSFSYATVIHYKKINERWQFSHSKMWYSFIIYGGNENVFSLIGNEIDFILTDRETENVSPIKPHKALSMSSSIEKQFDVNSDNFWENYNYLQIEE